MPTRSEQYLQRFPPILHRLVIHVHDNVANDRRTDPFVGEGKVNVGRIAAVEFEDWPHRRAHLLALHVGGVTGNTQSQKPNKGCDDCVISAGATRLRLFRHDADHIAGRLSVNQSDDWWEC